MQVEQLAVLFERLKAVRKALRIKNALPLSADSVSACHASRYLNRGADPPPHKDLPAQATDELVFGMWRVLKCMPRTAPADV